MPIDQIIGSVNRCQDFDRAFMPKRDELSSRWQSIARAFYSDVSLPPVELYKAGGVYFCLDGHHRISVARNLGMQFIEAEVTEIKARTPITVDLAASNLEAEGERARFVQQSHLDALRPGHNIDFTIGGSCDRLLEHIDNHRRSMEREQHHFIPKDEATCDWVDHGPPAFSPRAVWAAGGPGKSR